jgi:predicted NBD/HSP70 family sugar kinase
MVDESKTKPRRGADHAMMRELNRSLVLDVLKERSPLSRAAIAKQTALAKPTVSAIIDDLVTEDLVREIGVGSARTNGGRPPIMLEFNERSQFLVGVAVGVRQTTIVLADARGDELARAELPTSRAKPVDVFRQLANEIRKTLRTAGAPLGRLGAIGIVVPGLVDAKTAVCLLAPNIGWRDVPVRDLLARSFKVPIFVHNTSQAVAVAESIEGDGERESPIALLYASTGIGAGLLVDGHVYHGFGGVSGEIGHCVVPGATERCNCGKIGCLETIAAGPAIARAAERAVAAGKRTLLAQARRQPLSSVDVAAAAAAGDEVATEVLCDAGRALGIASSWLVNIFNPRLLIVAGGLAEIGEPIMAPLRAALKEHALPQAAAEVEVRASRLGADAAARGAVLLARQRSETYYRVVFQN